MTPERQGSLARLLTIAGLAGLIGCVAVLTADYLAGRRAAGHDALRVAALQVEAQHDAAAAATLGAEHDRITRARQARKARADGTAFVLLGAGVMFIAGAKWRIALGGRRPALTIVPASVLAASERHLARSTSRSAAQEPPPLDLSFVDAIVGREGTSREAAIPILQAIQGHYRYLPDAALQRVCELTDVSPAQIAGTSSFYARFRRSPVGDHVVRVCHGTACHVSGARQITDELRRALGIPEGADTDPHRRFTIDEVACVGCCSLAPVLMVDEHTVGHLTPATACEALDTVVAVRPAHGMARTEPA